MPDDASCHCITETFSSVEKICQLRRNESPRVMAKSSDFDSWVFSVSATVFRLCISAFFVLLLTSVFPVVLSANSSCLSQYWCISTDSSNPCTLHSLQSTATGQLCSCVDYQHNFTICLNNVSTSQHFYNFFVSKLIGIITVIENYYHC